ncbi:uncharacterized protein METZ01_LOCUS382282 [marine metagenome]|uniref:Uncharacterized protein n=1 Tax=marine metagenome TaxID=408172 RepID=A0A382U6Y6_9ZZZZ
MVAFFKYFVQFEMESLNAIMKFKPMPETEKA